MKVEVLGNTQDGGVPHLECSCDLCSKARENPEEAKHNASIMVKDSDEEDSFRYLIDATPDVRYQITGEYLDGVFISHGHLGHITGLLQFGEEGCNKTDLPLYVSDKTENYIRKNDPFRLLIDKGNVEIMNFNDEDEVDIRGGCIEAFEAKHNRVNTDTLSFMIHGEEKTLFYIADIHEWTEKTLNLMQKADIAIVDGTFWNEEEIERYEEVPHPVMKETMHLAEGWDTDIYFTHLNHTNPALREDTDERQEIQERGFGVVEEGMEFEL